MWAEQIREGGEERRTGFVSTMTLTALVLMKACHSFTRLEIMVMWLKVPRSPCFKGTVMKNVVQSLEKAGSSFWWRGGEEILKHCVKLLQHLLNGSVRRKNDIWAEAAPFINVVFT